MPPYSEALVTMLSPARARLRIVSVSAAWPDATPSAPTPPSRAATRSSKTSVVGIHDPGVDVAELLQPEEPGGVVGVVEDVARGGVDRDCASLRRGVDVLAGMDGQGFAAEGGGVLVGHGFLRWTAPPVRRQVRCETGPGEPWGEGCGVGRLPVVSSGETKNRGSCLETAAPGPILGPAALLGEPEPQTPSSALRGRPGMDIMEPRRHEAWREFSPWREVLAFIGREA